MAIDYNNLSNKQDNYDGASGRLTANEWNEFVKEVKQHDASINTLNRNAIKGVSFNGNVFTEIKEGILQMPVDTAARNVTFEWIGEKPTNVTVAAGASFPVSFKIIDTDVEGNPFVAKGIVSIYVDDNQSNSKVYTIVNKGHGDLIEFDLSQIASSKLMNPGNYTITIEYSNSNKVYPEYIAMQVVRLTLDIDKFKTLYKSTDNSWPTAYLTSGSTLHYEIKNAKFETISGNIVATYDSLSLKDILQQSKHGVNNVTLYCSMDSNGTLIETDKKQFKYLYAANNADSIISANVVEGSDFDLYNNVNVGFSAYVPSIESGTISAKIGLYCDDKLIIPNETPREIEVNISGNFGEGAASFGLVPDAKTTKDDILSINKIVISIDGYEDITTISINNKDVAYKEVPNYDVFFNADNNSNQGSHEWKSTGLAGELSMRFENVPFLGNGTSGWNEDITNGTSLKLRRGSKCFLDYYPFATNPAYMGSENSGLTVSIEFATSNCFKDNATAISCIDPSTGYGFEITASSAILKSSNNTLRANFKENSRIRLDFVIEGSLTTYTQKSWVPIDPLKPGKGQQISNAPSTEAMMLMYIDGVYVGLSEYGTKGGTNFKHSTNNPIVFGSDSCDLDIYKIRIYKNALNCIEIMDNYAYDANGVTNKTAIALRNNIFAPAQGIKRNKPDIDLAKLRTARPELPIFTVRLDDKHNENTEYPGDLTNDKASEKQQLCSMSSFVNPLSSVRDADIALTSWESNTGTIRNQGTSSMGYPWPWRNWDWASGNKLHTADKNLYKFYFPTLDSDVSDSKWAQYQYKWEKDTPKIKKLTFKKDYASSEMCNNAICSDLFTEFATMLASKDPKYVDSLLTERMRNEWNDTHEITTSSGTTTKKNESTDFRFSLKAKPCFMVQELSYNPNGGDPATIAGTAGAGKDALGMMNLIPNKNEVYYLGFTKNHWENNKWNKETGEIILKDDNGEDVEDAGREQAWELKENKDAIYWTYHIDPARIVDGEVKNEIVDHYEARTPKDSPIYSDTDFGDVNSSEFKESHIGCLEDQTKDICRLHNWFVDTNRYLATGKPIKELYSDSEWQALQSEYGYDDTWYNRLDLSETHPTENYISWRLHRFITEYEKYLIKDQWILYYIWRELFWMYDSGFKNLQVYTLDGQHWGTMVRDADTALGIENTGKDYFAPHLEDIDAYKIVDGVTQYGYGIAKNTYHVENLTNGYSPVLNGQFGSIWVNIRDSWRDDIGKMFNMLKSAGLSPDFVINKFRSHQENWCEALYNFGMRQYFAGSAFLENISAGLGDKKHSRAKWLERGVYYRTTKYKAYDENDYMYCRRGKQYKLYVENTLSDNTTKIELPEDEQQNVTFKSYIPIYIHCGGDQNNANNAFRLIDVNNDNNYSAIVSAVDPCGLNLPASESDENTALYGTRYITDMGELFKYCRLTNNAQTLNMPMLRNLEFGHDYRRDGKRYWTYTEGNWKELENNSSKVQSIPLSNLSNLEILDVTNHRSMEYLNGLDNCKQLKEIYISGTAVKSLNLPKTSTIEKLYLNDKLTGVNFDNLINLKDVKFDGYSNITSVNITNCSDYMKTESANIIKNCIDNLVNSYDSDASAKNCVLSGIYWENWGSTNTNGLRDYEILEKLVDINADIKGYIKVSKMTSSLKLKLQKYGDVDNNDPEKGLKVEYDTIYIVKDGVSFKRSQYWVEPSQSTLDMSVNIKFNGQGGNDPNTIISTAWKLEGANGIAEIDARTGVINRLSNLTMDEPAVVTVTIKQKQHPTNMEAYPSTLTASVNVYFTKHDAKPGDIVYADGSFSSEYDPDAKPIGVCYYVSEDQSERMMFAFGYPDTKNKYSWGLGATGSYTTSDVSPIGIKCSEGNAYDIETITNYTNYTSTTPSVGESFFETVYSKDGETFDELLNCAANGNLLKFETSTKNIDVIEKFVNAENKPKQTVIKSGEKIPTAYLNTVNIINIRNSVLLDNYEKFNTAIKDVTNVIPYKTDSESELSMLTTNMQLINNIDIISNVGDEKPANYTDTANMDLYFPAASYCWAYVPSNVDADDEKFGLHKWALPTAADASRILYYIYCITNGIDNSLSNNFMKLNGVSKITGTDGIDKIITSTESVYGKYYEITRSLSTSTYGFSNPEKYKGRDMNATILPVCKF